MRPPPAPFRSGSDAGVQGTNDDAQISKLSCVRLGYFEDDWVHLFVRRPQRRPPLINRGYWARYQAFRLLLFQFLSVNAGVDSPAPTANVPGDPAATHAKLVPPGLGPSVCIPWEQQQSVVPGEGGVPAPAPTCSASSMPGTGQLAASVTGSAGPSAAAFAGGAAEAFASDCPLRCQVVSLGAGFDTGWLQLEGSGACPTLRATRWIELDFPEVISRKLAVMCAQPQAAALLRAAGAALGAGAEAASGPTGSGTVGSTLQHGHASTQGCRDGWASATSDRLPHIAEPRASAGRPSAAAAEPEACSSRPAGNQVAAEGAQRCCVLAPGAGGGPVPLGSLLSAGSLKGQLAGGRHAHAGPPMHGAGSPPATASAPSELLGGRYCCVGVDLRRLPDVEAALLRANFNPSLPTLFLSECCLVYLEPAASEALLAWAARTLHDSGAGGAIAIYEQVRPDDAFGATMLANLAARGCPLLGIHAAPTLEQQVARLRCTGWDKAEAMDMRQVYERVLSGEPGGAAAAERLRIERLEMLDELEEWWLIQEHYCLALGTVWPTAPASQFELSFQQPPGTVASG